MRLLILTGELGIWRIALEFTAEHLPEVEDAAASLSRAAGGVPMRIDDDDRVPRFLNERGAFRASNQEQPS